MRSRYVLDNLILIDARRVLVVLSIDHQRYSVNRTFVGGEGDPSRVIGAGKHLSPPHQQELRALLTLREAECDAAGRASSIKGQHQSGLLRGCRAQVASTSRIVYAIRGAFHYVVQRRKRPGSTLATPIRITIPERPLVVR